jgi:hypothetical protein
MDTTHRTPWVTAGRVLTGLCVIAVSGIHAFFWVFISGWQCDESCDGGSWHATAGAWQWSALGWLGAASFLFALAFAIALVAQAGSQRVRIGLATATICAAIAPWILLGF